MLQNKSTLDETCLVNLCTTENIKEENKENSDVREIIFFLQEYLSKQY